MNGDATTKKIIGEIFQEIGEALETGQFENKKKIGVTLLGSEHGIENVLKGAESAQKMRNDIQVVVIGPAVDTSLAHVEANTEEECFAVMEAMLESGEIDGCVTMHYNFPIGVATVGRAIAPSYGRSVYLATTTGTASTNRIAGMLRNAIFGIATAKAMGIKEPSIGILNLDGARQVERLLKKLDANGYPIRFADSSRKDGGVIMRGNDLLLGSSDVMVMDTLTGNLMMKILSSFTAGGNYETVGYGYGPGVGENHDKTVLILSRASGIPVVANGIHYAADLIKGNLLDVTKNEIIKAKKAGLDVMIQEVEKVKEEPSQITQPDKEVVTAQISGIDILDLDEAVMGLWAEGIYAESGMGCTGPIIMVNETKVDQVVEILKKKEYVSEVKVDC